MSRGSNNRIVCLCLAVSFFVHIQHVFSQIEFYIDSDDYAAAIATNGFSSQNLDFDSVVAGSEFSPPTTIGAVTFDSFGPPDLIVTDSFATTSGNNYLGVSNTGFSNQFVGGYQLDLSFRPSNAIGLFVVSGEIPMFSIFDNDVQLVVPGVGTTFLDVDSPQAKLDGDNVYFLGLINTTATFQSALIRYDMLASEAIVFNIDDISTAIDVLLGDVNRDGSVNLLDVNPFIDVLSTSSFQLEADTNQDGVVNLLDVDSFIQILAGA